MSTRTFLAGALCILIGGMTLRTLWLTADPPTTAAAIVWHDEGAWVHNARNRVLWGTWRTDDWNPVFAVPVFTALEYVAFTTFGVGTWQARTVPVASGAVTMIFLMAGLAAAGNRRAALIGGALIATSYLFVMWNRAALAESSFTAFIVIGWAAYALAERRAVWGFVAGVAAIVAFFTKANAAFFVAALGIEAVSVLAFDRMNRHAPAGGDRPRSASEVRVAWLTLAGLAIAGVAALALFVLPHWHQYDFYNRVMSIERKPSYGLKDLEDRASWLAMDHDFFTYALPALVAGAAAIAGIAARWRSAKPAHRLLVLWVLVALLELTIHDSGNGRRYVVFLPALAALAALVASGSLPALPERIAGAGWGRRLAAAPLFLVLGYLVFGSVVRPFFLDEVRQNHYSHAVWLSAGLAGLVTGWLLVAWRPAVTWLSTKRLPAAAAVVLVATSVSWDLFEYVQWARLRTDLNYQASLAVGRLLPPGTLVQGKLANGLSLENQIRPLFVGNGFGNFADRFQRDDARYILTYDLPSLGFESQKNSGLIQQILDHYPDQHTIATFEVRETPEPNRAVLIDKRR